ncbi:MAG: GntR family transcriptional regulator [Pseudoflavonifractor sp.]
MGLEQYLPLHAKVKVALEEEILNGTYEEKLPGELELMERFSVSRATIRHAIDSLVAEGMLKKVHGKGTFVSFKPVEEWLGKFSTYQDVIRQRGMKPHIKFLSIYKTTEPKSVAQTIGQEQLYCLERMRYANAVPVSIEQNYYPEDIGEYFLNCNLDDMPTYSKLEESGITLWKAKQTITARLPNRSEQILLCIGETLPVFFMERINYDPEGRVVEYEQSVYRSDYYSFVVNFGRD